MNFQAVLEYDEILGFADLYITNEIKIKYFIEGALDRISREFDMDADAVVSQHAEWVAAGRQMPKPVQQPGTYKVTINRKMAEEWASRFDRGQGIPTTAGTHYLTPADMQSLIRFMHTEIAEYMFNDATEYADLIAATKRQIAKVEKTLAAIGQ